MAGRGAPRSRTGCSTCRTRKVKCDEERPSCRRCRSAQLGCEWLQAARRQSVKRIRADKAPTRRSPQYQILLPRDVFVPADGACQLRNSLQLSLADREYLVYFPNTSLVTLIGKPWKWGTLRYLYGRVASESSIVMRLILAISASEVEGRRDLDPENFKFTAPCRRGTGLAHYSAALLEFRNELAHFARGPPSQSRMDGVIAAFVLMVVYEGHFGSGWSAMRSHISGAYAFLKARGVLLSKNSKVDTELSVLSKWLLMSLMYMDLSHSWGDVSEDDSWNCIAADDEFCTVVDTAFLDSRAVHSAIFAEEYPIEALADDLAVSQPLDFAHECAKLKRNLVSYVRDVNLGREFRTAPESLFRSLERIGKRFQNFIILAQKPYHTMSTREAENMYYAVADYHALEVLYHHHICVTASNGSPDCHRNALAAGMGIVRKIMAMKPRAMLRVLWCLPVFARFLKDPKDRRWMHDTTEYLRRDAGMSGTIGDKLKAIWACGGTYETAVG